MSAAAGDQGQAIGSSRWMDTSIDPNSVEDFATDQDRLNVLNNFPNPVGDFTNIRIDLAESATVEVAVYDMNGRMMDRRSGLRLLAGEGQLIRLDNLRLPGGVYTYTVVADMAGKRFGASNRMVVR